MKRHPLADHHAGQPRKSMHHMYFGGYFYMRLHHADLTAVYRPTGDGPQDFHVGVQIKGHSNRKQLARV